MIADPFLEEVAEARVPRGPPHVVEQAVPAAGVGRRHPAQDDHHVAPRLPAQRAGPGPGRLVGLGAQDGVDDQGLEPGVPGPAHLRGARVHLGGGEGDLPGVAHDGLAHRGGDVAARILAELVEIGRRDLDAGSFTADRFILYQSHLSRHGAHYEEVAEYPLRRLT